jgi:lipopolysaccharide assembly outer membrane protein LptD (OstA)
MFSGFEHLRVDVEEIVMKKMIIGSLGLGLVIVAIAVSLGAQAANQKHAQIATPSGFNVQFAANNIQRQEQIMQLKGSVEVRTREMSLRADDVTYNQKTGELVASGNVRAKLETQN